MTAIVIDTRSAGTIMMITGPHAATTAIDEMTHMNEARDTIDVTIVLTKPLMKDMSAERRLRKKRTMETELLGWLP